MDKLPTEVLFEICSWLPVRDLITLRLCSKKFLNLLLSKSDSHWRRRIESTFPFNFKKILDEDLDQQLDHFARFRTIDTGNNITYVYLPKAEPKTVDQDASMRLQVFKSKDQMRLPWTTNILLIYKIGALFLFDVTKKVILAKIDLTVNYLWLDVPGRKVVCVRDRSFKIYSLVNNSFDLEYESIFDQENDRVYPILANDCIVYLHQNQLRWCSLKTKKIQRSYQCRQQSKLIQSLIQPCLYEVCVEAEERKFLEIRRIDCASETEPILLFKEQLDYYNCIVRVVFLLENDYGQLLHVQYDCFGKSILDVFDLVTKTRLFRCEDTNLNRRVQLTGDETFEVCCGAPYYKFARASEISVYKFEKGDLVEDLGPPSWYLGGCGPKKIQLIGSTIWLTPDILAVEISFYINQFWPCCIFYSISKNKIVGMVKTKVSEALMVDGKIIVFNNNGFYIITPHFDVIDDRNDEEINEVFPNQQFSADQRATTNQKRKLDERTASDSESSDDEQLTKRRKTTQ